jgi:hypothetical protein
LGGKKTDPPDGRAVFLLLRGATPLPKCPPRNSISTFYQKDCDIIAWDIHYPVFCLYFFSCHIGDHRKEAREQF